MNTNKFTRYGWLTASAVGVLLAQGVIAAEGDYEKQNTQAQQTQAQTQGQQTQPEQTQTEQVQPEQTQPQQSSEQQAQMQGGQQSAQLPEFEQLDQDGDGQAQWQDIESEIDQELQQANMDEQQVMDQFDQNNDQSLDQQEYDSFQTALQAQLATGQQTAQIPEFNEIDQDGDGQAQWQDIESELDQQLQQANMDEQQVMEQFDQNNDQALDQQEYASFQAALQEQTQMAAAQQGQQQDPQQAQQDQQQAQQDPQQQAQTEQEVDTTLMSMPVDQISQADVVNSRGEQIGSVSRVVRDENTGELALVVQSGGILGLGSSSILVNLEEVSQMGENQLLWDTMLSQEEIADMPGFDENQYTEISGSEYATLGEAARG